MKEKRLLLWTGALLVIVAIILISNYFSGKAPSEKELAFFPGVEKEDITGITIADKNDTANLYKKGDVWMITLRETETEADSGEGLAEKMDAPEVVEEYPADSASVQSVLDKLTAMQKDELVSRNPEKQSVFEVDSAKGILVSVKGKNRDTIGKFRIGKSGPDYSSHFVRMLGSNKVYSVRGSIRYAFFTNNQRWKDKTVIKFPKVLAKRVQLKKKDGESIELEKEYDSTGTEKWKITHPILAPAKKQEAENVVGALADLNCADWEKDTSLTSEDMGFDKPELVATVILDNDDTRQVMIGKKKEDTSQFWVKAEGKDDIVFLVYDHVINDIDKNIAQLKKEEEEKSEEEDVANEE
jgi:hypothetical protein